MTATFNFSTDTENGTRQEFFEKIRAHEEFLGLSKVYYAHSVELIDNIFHHAKPNELAKTEWHVNAEISGNSLFISVEDNGQGIPRSIQNKIQNPSLPSEAALQIALEGNFSNFRGQGLRSIISKSKSGALTLEIETENLQFLSSKNEEKIVKLDSYFYGTRIKIRYSLAKGSPVLLKLNDIVPLPGSRYIADCGDSSGEYFRKHILIPKLQAHSTVDINIDHDMGFAASWISGAFSGLADELKISPSKLLEMLKFSGEDSVTIKTFIHYVKHH